MRSLVQVAHRQVLVLPGEEGEVFPANFYVLVKGHLVPCWMEGQGGSLTLKCLTRVRPLLPILASTAVPKGESVAPSHSGQEGAQAPVFGICRATERRAGY